MSLNLIIDETVFNHKKETASIKTRGKTVGENLNYGVKQDPGLNKFIIDENGNLWTGILVKINGKFVQSNQLTTAVKDGDTIEILKFTG